MSVSFWTPDELAPEKSAAADSSLASAELNAAVLFWLVPLDRLFFCSEPFFSLPKDDACVPERVTPEGPTPTDRLITGLSSDKAGKEEAGDSSFS